MAEFNSAVVDLLKNEGGYQDFPEDPGNYDPSGNLIGTNFGITPRTYNRYYGRYPTVRQMKALPYIEAMDIYKRLYWDRNDLSTIPDQAVANQILDTLVLHGQGAGLIQSTANEMNYPLPIDNIYGRNTKKAVNILAGDPIIAKRFNNTLVSVRLAYVQGLVNRDPTLSRFLSGWRKRITDFHSITKPIKIAVVVGLLALAIVVTIPEVRASLRALVL